MKIQGKILLCLLSVFAFLMATGGATYFATSKVSYFRQRSLRAEAALLSATSVRAQVRNQLLETFDVLYVSGLAKNEIRIEKGKLEVEKKFGDLKKALERSNGDIRFADEVAEMEESYRRLQGALDQAVVQAKAKDQSGARATLIHVRETRFQKDFLKELTDIIDQQTKLSKEENENLEESISLLRTMLALAALVAFVMGTGLAVFVSRSIGGRLASIEKAAEQVSAGNLSVSVDEGGSDEVSTLARSINHMAVSLAKAQTDLVRQQQLLVQSSKMSSLGEMAGGIAHEINNPLAVIKMRAEVLRECVEEKCADMKMVAETCGVIVNTTERMARIITGLRTFARDGRADDFQPAKLQQVVEETLSFCREKFQNHQIPLEVKMPTEAVIFDCRATQISQVLINFVGNAFDAVQPLPTKWVRVEVRDLGEELELSVTDSGAGIPAAIRDKIAQPFFTTKEIGKGTGLGLSISRGIVESHRGKFWIDADCANTRFVARFPKAQPKKLLRVA